jgi:hypothetical protein
MIFDYLMTHRNIRAIEHVPDFNRIALSSKVVAVPFPVFFGME